MFYYMSKSARGTQLLFDGKSGKEERKERKEKIVKVKMRKKERDKEGVLTRKTDHRLLCPHLDPWEEVFC